MQDSSPCIVLNKMIVRESIRRLIYLQIFLFSLFSFGQPSNKEHLKIVDYNKNYIHFYNNTSNFNIFFSKLDTLLIEKKGKVRILQIGGSHIQAEIWPDQVRKRFLEISDSINGGRGFLFPFKLAKTWNPKNHQISSYGNWKTARNSINKHKATWGLSGYTVTTTDSLSGFSIGYKHDSLTNYKFNRVKIFHDLKPTSYDVFLASEKVKKSIINKNLGYTEFFLNKLTDTLSIEFRKTANNQNHFTLYGISLENDNPGLIYTSVGVNGAKTSSFLRNDLFVNHLQTVNPDLIIFCLGINDAYKPNFCKTCYEENYDRLVEKIKQVNPDAAILFVTNNDSYYKKKYANKNVFEAKEVMISLAKKYHAGMWDLFEIMGGLNSVKKWESSGYVKEDKIHFTNKGYQLIGDLMFEAIMKSFVDYKNNKLR